MAEEVPTYPNQMGPGNYEFCDVCGTYHMRGHYAGYRSIPEKKPEINSTIS